MLNIAPPVHAASRLIAVVMSLALISNPSNWNQPAYAKSHALNITITGWLTTIWIDFLPNEGGSHSQNYILSTDDGKHYTLLADADLQSELLVFGNQYVRITGHRGGSIEDQPTSDGVLVIETITSDSSKKITPYFNNSVPVARGWPLKGNRPFVMILCKFPDIGLDGFVTKQDAELEQKIAMRAWQMSSYNQVSFNGSAALGWYTLPHPKSHYLYDMNGDGREDFDKARAADDCTSVADSEAFFPGFRANSQRNYG